MNRRDSAVTKSVTALGSRSIPFGGWLAVIGLVALGCDNNPFSQVEVAGKVVYRDGTPIPAKHFQLWFTSLTPPKDERTFPRPASAFVASDGSFSQATTYRHGDGIIRGKHRVHLDIEPKDLVPEVYTSAATTPLELDTADAPFDIRIPKPGR